MAKDPVCPIYYNDLLGSTRDWTDEEFGCYVRLLLEQWDKGKIPSPYQKSTKNLPNDYQRLTRIATSVERNWELISTKFIETDGGLVNEVMEDIRTKRLLFKQKQSENRKKGYQNSTKLPTKPSTKTEPPLEEEKEIVFSSLNNSTLTISNGTWESEKKQFLIAEQWQMKQCSEFGLTRDRLNEEIKEFLDMLEKQEDYKDMKELKKHWYNWYRKKSKSKPSLTLTPYQQEIEEKRRKHLESR